jgi:glycosyltransferase involved in cell wall biosynthesis
MWNARALFVASYYLEPFGGVNVEAQLCGTPVITTDWGAFPETVLHGVTGYRCRVFNDFVWAAENVGSLKPDVIRKWAAGNYGMERISKMYDEYFSRLYELKTNKDGWYAVHDRMNLDWLVKYHN